MNGLRRIVRDGGKKKTTLKSAFFCTPHLPPVRNPWKSSFITHAVDLLQLVVVVFLRQHSSIYRNSSMESSTAALLQAGRKTIVLGTRRSPLALVQTREVQKALQKVCPEIQFELKEMATTGDKILDVPLAQIGDKGLFTKELELALLRNEIDLAVHSLKVPY